jgi:hypothetical protein
MHHQSTTTILHFFKLSTIRILPKAAGQTKKATLKGPYSTKYTFKGRKNCTFGEETLAIRDAMVEDLMRDKMIVRQKSKGKRKLLNLQSSIDYSDVKASSRRRKCKVHMM